MSHRQRSGSDRGPTARAHQGGANRGAGAYPRKLDPAVRPGDYVELVPLGEVRQVEVMVPQPGVLAFDSGSSNGISVGNNANNENNQPTELELPDGWLGQYRITQPANDINDSTIVRVSAGGKQSHFYTNKNFRGRFIDSSTIEHGEDSAGNSITADHLNSHLLEFYIWEDEVPYFDFEDTSGGGQTINDIRFQGFQFRLTDEVQSFEGHPIPLPVEAVRER